MKPDSAPDYTTTGMEMQFLPDLIKKIINSFILPIENREF